jgi:tetratricopeptide (TPR) repeat protein
MSEETAEDFEARVARAELALRTERELSPGAHAWLLLEAGSIVVTAPDHDETRHDRATTPIAHRSGMWRDTVMLAGEDYPLPVGAGKRGAAFVEAASSAAPAAVDDEDDPGDGADGDIVLKRDRPPGAFPRLGAMWFDEPEPGLANLIVALCGPGEAVLGLLECAPVDPGFDGAHLLVTDARAVALLTRADAAPLARDLADVSLERSTVGRDKVLSGDEAILSGPLVGKGELRELVELAALEPGARLLQASRAHAAEGDWQRASELLWEAERLSDEDGAIDAEAPADAELTVRQRVLLRRAQVARAMGREGDAVARLAELSQMRPADDLIAASRLVDPDEAWWALLAIAHEESGDHASAAAVYEVLATQEGADAAFWLLRARALREAGAIEDAITAYHAFVDARVGDQDFAMISRAVTREDADADLDDELSGACLELGALLEQTGQTSEAAAVYLRLVRQAPLSRQAYAPLFALEAELPSRERRVLAQVAQMLHLLDPYRAAQLDRLPEPVAPGELPHAWAPMTQAQHDEAITHPGERATASLAQRWVGGLVVDGRDTADIERHCQRVDDRAFPDTARLVSDLAAMLGVATPRVFLSHGLTGVQVLGGAGAPMLLLGAAHLDADHPQSLTLRQQAFALGGQLEHIRAGHLVLTSSEFWTAFRSRSLDGVVAALSLIPIGGLVGKATDTFAGSLIGRLSRTFDNKTVKGVVSYAEKKLSEEGTSGGVQAAYEATLGRALARGQGEEVSQETLLKEQLADFARCAMYTADRVGLLASDSLPDAVLAILKLSARASAEVDTLERHGLGAILSKRDADGEVVYAELGLRVGELLKFALSQDYLDLRDALWGEPQE